MPSRLGILVHCVVEHFHKQRHHAQHNQLARCTAGFLLVLGPSLFIAGPRRFTHLDGRVQRPVLFFGPLAPPYEVGVECGLEPPQARDWCSPPPPAAHVLNLLRDLWGGDKESVGERLQPFPVHSMRKKSTPSRSKRMVVCRNCSVSRIRVYFLGHEGLTGMQKLGGLEFVGVWDQLYADTVVASRPKCVSLSDAAETRQSVLMEDCNVPAVWLHNAACRCARLCESDLRAAYAYATQPSQKRRKPTNRPHRCRQFHAAGFLRLNCGKAKHTMSAVSERTPTTPNNTHPSRD